MDKTLDLHTWHQAYEAASAKTQQAVTDAFDACQEALRDGGLMHLAGDDRAEELIAAIYAYVVKSEDDAYGRKSKDFEEGR